MAKAKRIQYSADEVLSSAFDDTANTIAVTGGGASTQDGGTFTPSSDNGTPIQGVRQDTVSAVADQKYGIVRISSNRGLKVDQDTSLAGEDLTNNVFGISRKPVASATYSPSVDTAFGTAVTHCAKASAGNILSITCTNINAAIRYLQIFNKATNPVNTDVPIFSFPIPAGSATNPVAVTIGADFFGMGGYNLSTGVSWAVSTAQATLTTATTTDHNVNATYV